MMVAEGSKPKKAIRHAARATGFPALAAMGCRVGARSSRTPIDAFVDRLDPSDLGGSLFGGRISGPPARSDAQDRLVRVCRGPSLSPANGTAT